MVILLCLLNRDGLGSNCRSGLSPACGYDIVFQIDPRETLVSGYVSWQDMGTDRRHPEGNIPCWIRVLPPFSVSIGNGHALRHRVSNSLQWTRDNLNMDIRIHRLTLPLTGTDLIFEISVAVIPMVHTSNRNYCCAVLFIWFWLLTSTLTYK